MAPELPRFSTDRRQRGYATDEVDAFLSSVFDRVAQGAAPPDIRKTAFRTKLGGYDEQEVDAFIASVFDAVREGRPAPPIIEAAFPRAWRGGYAERDVDDYLDTLAGLLGQ